MDKRGLVRVKWVTAHGSHQLVQGDTLTSFNSSSKWDCVVFVLPCQAYFTQHNVFQIHPFRHIRQDFLFFKAESRIVVTRGWREGKRGVLPKDTKFQLYKMNES